MQIRDGQNILVALGPQISSITSIETSVDHATAWSLMVSGVDRSNITIRYVGPVEIAPYSGQT
jgi:hypothetical protein